HRLGAVYLAHRVGVVPEAEPSVVVAASAPHRAEAFAGCRELIDELKATVPIWKKELWAGGGKWVGVPDA
ncbi:MAG TPA: molybdenum cofactor biosynthesis protein MoaE, partial [Actinomycetes bacterium]|nr:molybdenum cofactor biosynthesis protein MoaE [Actinomycetes bacterium]